MECASSTQKWTSPSPFLCKRLLLPFSLTPVRAALLEFVFHLHLYVLTCEAIRGFVLWSYCERVVVVCRLRLGDLFLYSNTYELRIHCPISEILWTTSSQDDNITWHSFFHTKNAWLFTSQLFILFCDDLNHRCSNPFVVGEFHFWMLSVNVW